MDTNALQKRISDRIEVQERELAEFRNNNGTIEYRPIDEYPYNRIIVRFLKRMAEIKWLYEYSDNTNLYDSELVDRLTDLKEAHKRLRDVLGDELDKTLQERVNHYYELYPRNVCRVFEFEPINNDTPNRIDQRDTLQYLLDELHIDDPQINEGIRVLDNALKCKYKYNSLLVDELNLERSHYPAHYWWRHPEQVLSED